MSFYSFIFTGATKSMKKDMEKFGVYQLIMFILISLPLMFTAGFTLSYVFTAGEIKYRYAYILINYLNICSYSRKI